MRARHQLRRSWYFSLFVLPFLAEWVARNRRRQFDTSLRRGGMTRQDVDRVHREVVEYGALSGGLGWYRALPFEPFGWAKQNVAVPTTYVWSDRTSRCRASARRSAAGGSPVPTSSWCSRA